MRKVVVTELKNSDAAFELETAIQLGLDELESRIGGEYDWVLEFVQPVVVQESDETASSYTNLILIGRRVWPEGAGRR